ncbi:hypothetical protein OHT76_04250 [Streptomyces sp. NBC_00287]|nr:hypothetical protein [Streptomyces sp. NBC_00287]
MSDRTTDVEKLIGTFYEAFSGRPELLDSIVADDWDDIPRVQNRRRAWA